MSGYWLRAGSRVTAVLLAALVVLLFGATPAWAHGGLERSDPPNGGVVAVGRTALTLWFTEAITASASTFELQTSDGIRVVLTASVSETDSGGIVRIETPALEKATYLLDWKVLSTEDGHVSNGSVSFGVGTRPAVLASTAGGIPDVPGLLLRWVDLSAIMLVIGALAVSGRVFGSMGEPGNSPRRRSILIAAVAAGVAVLAGAIAPFLLTQNGGNSLGAWLAATWDTLTDTGWGHLWLGRELALTVMAVALFAATRAGVKGLRRTISPMKVAVVALAVAVGLESWVGHSSTLPTRSALAAFASASHLVAAGVWAGGLVILALCLMPVVRRSRQARGPILASAWRAFSPMAAIATVVLLATGLYEAGRHIPELSSVASTLYGGTVAVKVALVTVALALAGINTLLVNPPVVARVGRVLGRPAGWTPVPPRRFPTVVAAEVLILALAVGAAGVLTSVPTAREIASATSQPVIQTATVDGLFVTVEQVAAGPAQSRLIVRSQSVVKVEALPVNAVDVSLTGPTGATTTVSLDRIEPGRYEAETAKPTLGDWTATVALQRDGLLPAVTQVGWTVSAPGPDTAGPLEVVTTGLAVLLLVALSGVVGFTRRRREDTSRPSPRSPVLAVPEEKGNRR